MLSLIAEVPARHGCIRQLLQGGADLAPSTGDGWNALLLAANRGDAGSLAALLGRPAAAALIEARTPAGDTALLLSSRAGSHDAVKLLLAAGADPAARNAAGAGCVHLAVCAAASRADPADGLTQSFEGLISLLVAAGAPLCSGHRPELPAGATRPNPPASLLALLAAAPPEASHRRLLSLAAQLRRCGVHDDNAEAEGEGEGEGGADEGSASRLARRCGRPQLAAVLSAPPPPPPPLLCMRHPLEGGPPPAAIAVLEGAVSRPSLRAEPAALRAAVLRAACFSSDELRLATSVCTGSLP